MAKVAPGHRSSTAWAMTWAVEWRIVYRPRSLVSVTTSTRDPSGRGSTRSRSTPSTLTITAARASREPMARARSAPVAPSSRGRDEPSGRVTVIWPMAAEPTAGPAGARTLFPAGRRPTRAGGRVCTLFG